MSKFPFLSEHNSKVVLVPYSFFSEKDNNTVLQCITLPLLSLCLFYMILSIRSSWNPFLNKSVQFPFFGEINTTEIILVWGFLWFLYSLNRSSSTGSLDNAFLFKMLMSVCFPICHRTNVSFTKCKYGFGRFRPSFIAYSPNYSI